MKGIFLPVKWSCALLLALSFSSATAQIPVDLREKGVLYFDGNLPDKIIATIHASTTVYMDHFFDNELATLYSGQEIELVGMSPDGYVIRTNYRNNTLNGWIRPEELPTGIDPSLFELAKKNQAHHDAVARAIARKSVIQGMTPDEVKQSVGSPEQTLSHTDANNSSLSWIYTTYRDEYRTSYVPDIYGRMIAQTYTVKIPTGQMIIDFSDGVVSAITEHKTNENSPGIRSD